ncbi:MAG: serpin family protein [Bacteroidales bacterium]|nr:serpin family protein [Bacteroidales bacterium]
MMKYQKVIFITVFALLFFKIGTAQNFSTQVENNNRFCFDLYNYIETDNKNLFISPFSVSSALAMTYEGAKEKTRKEMAKVLRFPDNKEQINQSFKDIIDRTQNSKDKKKYTFNIANSLWAQNDFEFLDSFFTTIKKYYNAPVESVNFKDEKEREKARLKINKWVSKKTNKKINDLLDKSALDNDTKLVLVNAVYFIAEWSKAFNKKLTKPDVFYTQQGSVNKDFMHTSSRMKYIHAGNIQLLEIPYKNEKASMIILLPDKVSQFYAVKKRLNNNYFESLLKKAEFRNVSLSLPKFKIEYKNDLAKILLKAGMKRAFSNNADFSGMTCEKNLKIDKIIHQTFINVDESGTEAAAATAVVMKRITSINPNENVIFKANKPFIFVIKEKSTGSILFIGQLVK